MTLSYVRGLIYENVVCLFFLLISTLSAQRYQRIKSFEALDGNASSENRRISNQERRSKAFFVGGLSTRRVTPELDYDLLNVAIPKMTVLDEQL